MSPADSLADWLRLTLAPGLGGEAQRRLLAAFGPPNSIFAAGHAAARGVVGERADQLFSNGNRDAVEAALAWASEPGHGIITLADSEYPPALLAIPDPPTLLYLRGRTELLRRPALAIVGSRNATPQGLRTAGAFARELAGQGFAIVSGLALGVDAAAHQGALDAGGDTLAVIGTGPDRIYPARNKELALTISERGLVISEFPLATPPLAGNFPRRNRIISGLAQGVLVVEAAIGSGSLITARLAAEQGREVFAIPGSIHSPLARGCHQLIKEGAKLVESSQDILDEFAAAALPPRRAPVPAAQPETPLLQAIGHDPCSLDELAARTGLGAETLLAELLSLELAGAVATLPGNRYQRLD